MNIVFINHVTWIYWVHGHPTQMPGTIKPFFIEMNTLVEKQKYPLVANWLTFTIQWKKHSIAPPWASEQASHLSQKLDVFLSGRWPAVRDIDLRLHRSVQYACWLFESGRWCWAKHEVVNGTGEWVTGRVNPPRLQSRQLDHFIKN